MRDRREEILTRLEAILYTIVMTPPLVHVVRNKAGLPDERRPAIILLDADEALTQRIEQPSRGLTRPPQLMAMTPQIFYLAGNLPQNTTVGQHLNAARIAIMDAIMHDDQLRDICGANGSIYYGGCETDLKTGSTIEGQMQINPVFIYPFIPRELRAEGV